MIIIYMKIYKKIENLLSNKPEELALTERRIS